jgi:hypothetical protein
MAGPDRRQWKLRAIRAISTRLDVGISTIRRTIGGRNFSALIEEAYRESPADPERGASLIERRLIERYSVQLARPKAKWERD